MVFARGSCACFTDNTSGERQRRWREWEREMGIIIRVEIWLGVLPPSPPTQPPLLMTDVIKEAGNYVGEEYRRSHGSVVRAVAVTRSAFPLSCEVAEEQSAAAPAELESVNGTVPGIDT